MAEDTVFCIYVDVHTGRASEMVPHPYPPQSLLLSLGLTLPVPETSSCSMPGEDECSLAGL